MDSSGSTNPYETPTVAAGGERESIFRVVVAVGCFLLMFVVAVGFAFGFYHDWKKVGLQLPNRPIDWYVLTLWLVDIVAMYGIGVGVLRRQRLLTLISFVPIVISIVSGLVLLLP